MDGEGIDAAAIAEARRAARRRANALRRGRGRAVGGLGGPGGRGGRGGLGGGDEVALIEGLGGPYSDAEAEAPDSDGSDRSRSPRPPRCEHELAYMRGMLVGGIAAAAATTSAAAWASHVAILVSARMERGLRRVIAGTDTEWNDGHLEIAEARAAANSSAKAWDALWHKMQE